MHSNCVPFCHMLSYCSLNSICCLPLDVQTLPQSGALRPGPSSAGTPDGTLEVQTFPHFARFYLSRRGFPPFLSRGDGKGKTSASPRHPRPPSPDAPSRSGSPPAPPKEGGQGEKEGTGGKTEDVKTMMRSWRPGLGPAPLKTRAWVLRRWPGCDRPKPRTRPAWWWGVDRRGNRRGDSPRRCINTSTAPLGVPP